MTADQLKESVKELTTLLQELDKVIPTKVDPDLVSFLQSVDSHPWIVELLAKALVLSRASDAKGPKR